MSADEGVWPDLIVAILSVNSYPLERTYQHVGGLREQGLCQPQRLATWELGEIAKRLGRAGYARGPVMTDIFSRRLAALGQFVVDRGVEACEDVLTSGSTENIAALLRQVHGIGDVVVRNYLAMRGYSLGPSGRS